MVARHNATVGLVGLDEHGHAIPGHGGFGATEERLASVFAVASPNARVVFSPVSRSRMPVRQTSLARGQRPNQVGHVIHESESDGHTP